MPEASPNGTETELALAVTQGVPAAKWARTTGVPSITAWRWAKDPVILPFAAMPVSLGAGLGNRFEFVSCQLSVCICQWSVVSCQLQRGDAWRRASLTAASGLGPRALLGQLRGGEFQTPTNSGGVPGG